MESANVGFAVLAYSDIDGAEATPIDCTSGTKFSIWHDPNSCSRL